MVWHDANMNMFVHLYLRMYACILFVYAFMHLKCMFVHDAEQQCYIGWTLLHQAICAYMHMF